MKFIIVGYAGRRRTEMPVPFDTRDQAELALKFVQRVASSKLRYVIEEVETAAQ